MRSLLVLLSHNPQCQWQQVQTLPDYCLTLKDSFSIGNHFFFEIVIPSFTFRINEWCEPCGTDSLFDSDNYSANS